MSNVNGKMTRWQDGEEKKQEVRSKRLEARGQRREVGSEGQEGRGIAG